VKFFFKIVKILQTCNSNRSFSLCDGRCLILTIMLVAFYKPRISADLASSVMFTTRCYYISINHSRLKEWTFIGKLHYYRGWLLKTLKMQQHVYKRHALEPFALILIAVRTSHSSECMFISGADWTSKKHGYFYVIKSTRCTNFTN
jgi:hypothetical protein